MMVQYNKVIKPVEDVALGYFYFMDKEHPLANRQGKVYYHRHIASLRVNRWIESFEHVHHQDQNKKNNDPNNLLILSSSVHAHIHKGTIKEKDCLSCLKKFKPSINRIRFCSYGCSRKASRKFEISSEELLILVWKMPTTKIAKMFNVTDNAIAKRCKIYNIEKPPRGYWAKQASLAK